MWQLPFPPPPTSPPPPGGLLVPTSEGRSGHLQRLNDLHLIMSWIMSLTSILPSEGVEGHVLVTWPDHMGHPLQTAVVELGQPYAAPSAAIHVIGQRKQVCLALLPRTITASLISMTTPDGSTAASCSSHHASDSNWSKSGTIRLKLKAVKRAAGTSSMGLPTKLIA